MNKPTWTKENAEELLRTALQPDDMMHAYKAGWAAGWIAATFSLRDMVASGNFSFDEACELVTKFWSIGPLLDYANDIPSTSDHTGEARAMSNGCHWGAMG